MKLDTEHNLLTVLLLGGIAALGVVFVLSFLVFGRADADRIAPGDAGSALLDRSVAQRPELAELGAFREIIERPVFFADRNLPVVELADAEESVADVPEPEPDAEVEVPDLKSVVAGIIITPDLKLAMVTDNDSNETLLLSEGMTMAGDKSAWRVIEIQPRQVKLQAAGGEQVDLPLEVETQGLKAGARPPRRVAQQQEPEAEESAAEQGAEEQTPDDAEAAARARAEEIRRRVAERRAQLRAEAEQRAQQRDGGN